MVVRISLLQLRACSEIPVPPSGSLLPLLKLLFPRHARKSTCYRDGQTCSTFR